MAFIKSFLQQTFKGLRLQYACRVVGEGHGGIGDEHSEYCPCVEFIVEGVAWLCTRSGHSGTGMGLAIAMTVSDGPFPKSCALCYLTEISLQPCGVGLVCFHFADEQTGSDKEQVAQPRSHSCLGVAIPPVVSDSQVYRVNSLHMNQFHSESTFIPPICS